ncbi:MAG: (d)CMP kinase [Phycisphaerales bacterium]|nr:MAG: (d)CMP kinase [Phycisphaerales bacterium]
MIITIDGPAGSGKSTVARELAARLGIAYLDTGAMYRAVALAAMERNVDFSDHRALCEVARSIRIELDCGPKHTCVLVDGRDVSEAIRTLEVSAMTSRVAAVEGVREQLITLQREIGAKLGSFVAEGRDQGSVVFPKADMRFVLEASLEERARRRRREYQAGGQASDADSVTDNLQARDSVDARQWEPLLASGDAVIVDTTNLSVQQVVDCMIDRLGLADDDRLASR